MTSPIQETFTRESSDRRVLVADGHNVVVQVQDMHLTIKDGMAGHRRVHQYARSEREFKRLIILCHNGWISLDALRWMSDVGLEWVMLHPRERSKPRWGQLIGTSGQSSTESELRHLQAQMYGVTGGVDIWRYLLTQKFAGHQMDSYDTWVQKLKTARTLERLREVESTEAEEYFNMWRGIKMEFTGSKVPDTWRTFTSRRSGIRPSRSKRATTPINAILNYCYAILEAEAVLACFRYGLDPDLGINHIDRIRSHAFAYDLMEAGRGEVDRWVRNLVTTRTFRRQEFTQDPEGAVRLLRPLTHLCAEQCIRWSNTMSPAAEQVVHMIQDNYRLTTKTNQLERIVKRIGDTEPRVNGRRSSTARRR